MSGRRLRTPGAVVVLFALASVAWAQPCFYEVEPNDTPVTANETGIDTCLTGELAGQDQDAFVWEVSEEDALRSWRLEVEGIRGQLTKFDVLNVEYTADRTGVTGFDTLLTWGTDDGSRNVSEPFLVSPGRYVIGVSKSGGEGRYVAHFRTEAELQGGRRVYRGEDHEGEHALYGSLSGDIGWAWTLNADDADRRWEILLHGPIDRDLEVELVDPDGEIVASGRAGDSGGVMLSSLGLAEGRYELRVEGGGDGAPFAIDVISRGRVTDGDEIEPNDRWSDANRIGVDAPLRGAGTGSDRDHYLLEVKEDQAGRAYDLRIEADGRVDVVVYDRDLREVQSRSGSGGVLRGLVLDEGVHGIRVSSQDVRYSLAFEEAAAPADGFEREPNDELVGATLLGEDLTARGELHAQDEDVFGFDVAGEPRIWRIQAIGPGLTGIATYDGGGSRQASLSADGRLRLDHLVLPPGRHYVRLEGEGEYALRAIALGPAPEPPAPAEPAEAVDPEPLAPADAGATGAADEGPPDPTDSVHVEEAARPGPPPPPGVLELEPNDDETRSELLSPGVTRVGVLASPEDADHYRFFLAHDTYVRIEAQPPADGALAFDTTRAPRALAGGSGEPSVLERRLLAGDYVVRLWPREASDGYYQLRLTHLDPLDPPVDFEPNDSLAQANPLPPAGAVEGRVGEASDDDFYALPDLEVDTELTVRTEMDGPRLALFSDARLERGDGGVYRAVLPAGEAAHLRVRGRGDYRFEVSLDPPARDPGPAPRPDGPALALSLEGGDRTLAAYWHQGQAVEGELVVENLADVPRDVRLEARPGDLTFEVELPDGVHLAAGETARIPYRVLAPDDVRDDGPVRVTFAARAGADVVTDALDLTARCEAPPVDPFRHWAVPDVLAGHLNVAWSPFGATVTDPQGSNDVYVNDGWTSPGRGSYRDSGEAVTVRLPGDEPYRLTGILLHPQSRNIERQLRTFELSVSDDGEDFRTVLQDSLAAARVEQAFVLEPPVTARHVRLRFLDDHAGGSGAWLGEWKVLAEEAPALPEFDLADPELGGVQVWSDPLVHENAVLAGEPRHPTIDGRRIEEATWVIGFHHGRAAQLSRLEWVESDRSAPEGWFERVRVDSSVSGPVGPWTEIAHWTLDRDDDGRATLAFDEPVWARYLRFRADGHDGGRTAYLPEEVRVIERPRGDGYRSALGEWGHYRPVGPYEASLEDVPVPRIHEAEDGDDDRSTARVVASGGTVADAVSVAEDEDWLRIDVPEGENLLQLRLEGDPTIGYLHELTDASGEAIVHDVQEDGEALVLTAFVEPGPYFLHLWEPRRSVVFSWDTSGSVGPFEDITYASVSRFARDVDPDREYVQMLAFDDPRPQWLMPFWSGDPLRVTRALNEFDRTKAASSSAETALLEALRGLRGRDGTRAVLFITDHESGSYGSTAEMWRLIEETRPRLFTFEISTGGSGITQDRMQAYAAANGGYYDYARNVGDFDVGFARASCHLRRPKAYEVHAVTRYREPPGPGTLRVVRGGEVDGPAVQVIFDASGSMGVPMPDGVPRIDAGKRVLRGLVEEILPEGTPFALRAFGHVAPSSCETRLDVPLGPLDRAAARAGIDAIEPKLLSQTAIAASLERVPDDLGEGDGARVVIVITDGEESCGGDPEAVVRDLQARGYDVQLAIVSLALSEEAAKERFAALAEVAGGTYADVTDGDALRASVEAALYPTFEVLDPAGEVVARGRVEADAVEVPMGVYSVRVPGHPLVREVRVPGDGAVDVTVGGD